MTEAINIILNVTTVPPFTEFVEIENDNGKTIRIGERTKDGNFIKLRITLDDIYNMDD